MTARSAASLAWIARLVVAVAGFGPFVGCQRRPVASSGAPPPVARFRVPLHVSEWGDVSRPAWPVTSGVPFPRGELQDVRSLRLTDERGTVMNLQAKPLARWDDGSVQWALLDFMASTRSSETTNYVLEVDATPAGPTEGGAAVVVTESPSDVTVNTGPLRAVFSRRGFGALSRVDLDGATFWERPGELSVELEHQAPGPPQEEDWLRPAAGGSPDVFVASACGERVEVEDAGPIRATIHVSGCHADASGRHLAPYDIRAYFYAGQTTVRLLHTFMFDGDPKTDFIRGMSWRLPGVDHPTAFSMGLPGNRIASAAKGPLGIVETGPDKIYHLSPYTEDKDVSFAISGDNASVAKGVDAPGWADVSSAKGGVTLAVRDFASQHPKGINLTTAGEIQLELWPREAGRVLDLRRRSDVVDNVYHYDLHMWPHGGRGIAKTQEFLLDFHHGPVDPVRANLDSQGQDHPLQAYASPAYYAGTSVFGPFFPRSPAQFPGAEAVQDFVLAWIRRNQAAFHWDGMIDFGDTLFQGYEVPTHYGYVHPQAWGSRGYDGWLNNDGDLVHTLFLQYLRSGDPRVWHMAESMVRHVTDVDTCHYDPDEPHSVGGGHRHDQQHWGSEIVGYGTSSQGALDFYLMTGDTRALDVARENARFHMAPIGEDEDRYGQLLRLSDILNDDSLRRGAEQALTQELAVPPGKAWPFVTDRNFRFISNTSISFLMAETVRPDPRLEQAILRAVDAIADDLMSDWREQGFVPAILIAEAYRWTRSPKYLDLAKAAVKDLNLGNARKSVPSMKDLDALPFEDLVRLGRTLGINNIYLANINMLCSLPYLLSVLAESGTSELACDAFVLHHDAASPFSEELDPKRIQKEAVPGHLYKYPLDHASPSDQRGGPSTLQLYENDVLLGPAHSPHQNIRDTGDGRWSHYGANTIWFSTSDNSDPRTNGRKYSVRLPAAATAADAGSDR